MGRSLAGWEPEHDLELDGPVRDRLVEAARQGEEWLYHPLVCAVTLGERRLDRDLRLALWAGAHQTDGADLGSVNVPAGSWGWGAEGGRPLEPGRHDLETLGRDLAVAESAPLVAIELDVWIDSVGLPLPPNVVAYEQWSWAHHQPLSDIDAAHLQREVVAFLRAVRALEELHPDCAAWVAAVTKVVVPLYGEDGTRFRSGSAADIPGLIFADIDGPIAQTLESMVHESAHLWFCLAERDGALIDPNHDGRYKSPLRADPRPLRGIFLAFHALAYMGAFYRDWAEVAPGREDAIAELDAVRSLRDDAASTIASARGALTDAGASFFDTTMELAVGHAG